MRNNRLDAYLRDLEKRLRLKGALRAGELEELEGHLLEAVERGMGQGLERQEAERQALQRFGSARAVAATFEKEEVGMLQKILLVAAALCGLAAVFVDTRPTWDDTGVLAGAILLACGLIALLGFKRPWLLALLVGAWIPLYGLLVSHQPAALIALAIAFLGAYAGWALRGVLNKIFHLA